MNLHKIKLLYVYKNMEQKNLGMLICNFLDKHMCYSNILKHTFLRAYMLNIQRFDCMLIHIFLCYYQNNNLYRIQTHTYLYLYLHKD